MTTLRDHGVRLVVYPPFSDTRLGILPDPLEWTWAIAENGWPLCTVKYAEGSVRSQLLEQRCELALEYWNGTEWQEPFNGSRMLRTRRRWDRKDKRRVREYTFKGMGWLMASKMRVWDTSTQDPADGPVRAVRSFHDAVAGEMLVPLFNAAADRIWPVELGFDDPPHKDFDLHEDTNDVTFTVELEGRIDVDITQPLAYVENIIVIAQMAQPVWRKHKYQLYEWGTYGTNRADTVTILDVNGIDSAPEDQDDEDLAARVLAIAEAGRFVVKESDDPELEYGSLESAFSAPGAYDEQALAKLARAESRAGEHTSEQLTREGHFTDEGPLPLRDYEVSDRVRLQKEKDTTTDRFVVRPVVEMSLSYSKGKDVAYHIKCGDRRQDRLARKLAQLNRMTLGAHGGQSPSDPGTDVRYPQAPENVQVTVTTYADDSRPPKTRGDVTITWDEVLYALDPDDPPGTEPIALRGYEIGEHRFGEIARIAAVDATELSWRSDNVLPASRDYAVRAVSKQGFPSAWSDDVDGTVTRDEEPKQGEKVLDARFVNPDIRAKRTAVAGTGFGFGSAGGRMRAQFTSTTPVLRTRVGGLADAGWVPVTEGEKWLVGGTARKIGSPTASARYGVTWRDVANNVTEVTNVLTQVATTSDVRATAIWTVPSGAVEAYWRCTAVSLGGGGQLEVVDPVFERQTSEERFEDGAASEPKLATDSVSTVKVQALAISNPKVAASAIDQPKMAADSVGTPELITGTHLDGSLDTGSIDVGATGSGRLILSASGEIDASGGGLMTYDAASHQLEGNGNLHGAWTYTGSFGSSSLREHKQDMVPITMVQAEALLSLEPFKFRYKPEWQREEHAVHMLVGPAEGAPPGTRTRRRLGKVLDDEHVGLAAEDVEATGVLDELLVKKDGKTVGLEIQTGWLYLLPLIKELREQRAQDRREIEALRQQMARGRSDLPGD